MNITDFDFQDPMDTNHSDIDIDDFKRFMEEDIDYVTHPEPKPWHDEHDYDDPVF